MSGTPEKRPAYEPAARLLRPTGYDPHMARPTSIYAGVGLVMLRVLAGIATLLAIAFGWHGIVVDLEASIDGFDMRADVEQIAAWFIIGAGSIFVLIDALLAFFVFRGHNIARVIVMLISAGSIVSSFIAWWVQGQEINLHNATFVSLALDILILLALSSRSAAAYARRNERR